MPWSPIYANPGNCGATAGGYSVSIRQVAAVSLVLGLALLHSSCSCSGHEDAIPSAHRQSVEAMVAAPGTPKAEVGEACTGPTFCKSGVCFRHTHDRAFCTVRCASDLDCPRRAWHCRAAMDSSFCVADPSWTPLAVEALPTSVLMPLSRLAESPVSRDGGLGDHLRETSAAVDGGFSP